MARSSKKPSKRGPNQKKRPFKKASFKPRKQQQKEEQSDGSSEAEAGDFEDILSRIRGLNSDDSDQDIDDDEELDSDLADTDGEDGPGESQKQRSRAPAKKSGQAEIDLNEDSDGPEEDNTGDGMVDLSTMLDLQPQESPEDSDSDQLSQDSDENGTEDDDEALDKLNAFISSLPTDQQAQLAESSGGKKRKLAERTESQPENEFATVGGHKKLRLEDMLSTLPAGQAKSMKKSLKPLITSKDSQNAGPLPAPLDSRSQAKLDRQAAREKLSGEVDKWNTTVSQMKGIGSKTSDLGTHRITLPLNAPDLKTAPSAAELGSQFHASNDMEKQISDLLKTSAMTHPRQQQASEEAAMAKMRFSAEEQAARQAAVRKQRELMFRAERKNKRLNKIKSKAYRRLARKEASNKLTMEEMEQLDEIDEGSRAQEARERMEVERAKERAGLRHSSKRNRFAREVQGMHGLEVDDELRRGEVERVQREQKLREKIMGQPQDSDADDDDEDASIDENDDEAIRAAAVKELDRGDARDAQEQSKREAPKGLMGMKFMQAAMARREVEQKDLEDQFRKDIQGENSGRESDSAEENNDAAVDGNAGRRVFIPPRREEQTEFMKQVSPDVPSEKPQAKQKNQSKLTSVPIQVDAPIPSTSASAEAPPVNPWLAAASSIASTSKASSKITNQQTAAEKSQLKARKAKGKNADERAKAREENEVLVDPNNVLVQEKEKKKRPRKRKGGNQQADQPRTADKETGVLVPALDSDNASSSGDISDTGGEDSIRLQRDLVARAFAGDDVVADFEAEKEREIAGDAPQEIDVTIPGWGSWGGKGVRKSKANKGKPRFIKHQAGIQASERKDAGLTNVILSEKREKRSAKYLVKDLPHPYTSAAQHEQSLRVPLGPEWQTGPTHRSFTRPQVLTRMGQIIDPVSKHE